MYYWVPRTWEIRLQKPNEPYWRIPILLMLLMAPAMGALLVVFLPTVGFILLMQHVLRLGCSKIQHLMLPVRKRMSHLMP